MIDWHRLFGLTLKDFFTNSPFEVELEKDLSFKRQMLDVVILRKKDGEVKEELPDGLDNLADHNLLSYKSLREPFDDWVLKELTGHYVNYRKQVSPSFDKLLPEEKFRLYGISTRFPKKLSAQTELEQVSPGVYDVIRGTDNIRIIVLSEIPEKENNAIWHLFSGIFEKVKFAVGQYKANNSDMSTVIYQLFEKYNLEGVINMPYTMEDFRKAFVKEHLGVLSPDEILERFSPEDRLKGISPEEVLKRYTPEDRLKGISPEEIKAYLKLIQNI
jgi:hypothetical protein